MSRERIQRRKLWMQMSGGVRVEVTLLDGRKLEFSVGARLLTQDLMSLVTSHFSLRESQYFALAYKDPCGRYHWLLDDRRLLDHDFARGVRLLPLHFLVRFFPETVTELRDAHTVELFYQHAQNIIASGELEVDECTAVRLAALSLQASIGNFVEESITKSYYKKPFLSSSHLGQHHGISVSEEKICGEHQQLIGLSRGDAILSYMRQTECIPGYGVHFYEVKDRTNILWHLGISQKGISQYDYQNRRKPKRIFFWKQLENLYFRERKFSIEVHDPKRVVLALNSFNLYEGAIEDSRHLEDDLLQAITEDTTQVSVSRRTFGPGNVSVYVWFAESQSLCKSIWSMAIAQHQFYLDRKTSRAKEGIFCRELQDPPDLIGELSRSCVSLSTHSSSPNLSRSGSHSSLQHHSHTEDSASTESLHAARMEMLSALQQRYDALQEKLDEKTEELRLLCVREGELTGELPPEYPRVAGEPLPVVRKRVGTSFLLDEALINKIINKQEETVASLELEYEIQAKIASAALRLANESSSKKGLRRQRKQSYQQSAQRLRDIEQKLRQAKSRQAQVLANNSNTMPKMKKKPRPVSDGEGMQDDIGIGGNIPLSPQEPLKETSFIDGGTGSPAINGSSHTQAKLKSISMTLHSAPPSPQRNTSGHLTPSDSSSGQLSGGVTSGSSSPARPTSGYIPSCVYTRNQYRAQHYPTLSTRGQSVPSDNPLLQRSFNGGLYNLPHQRTSIASHSLDDLDSSNASSPQLSTSKPPSHSLLPPQTHNSGNYCQQHTKPPQQHNSRKQRNESHDRFGSLDRRRAASGRVESRSMEHLDSLSPYTPSSSPVQTPSGGAHPSFYPTYLQHDLSYTNDPSINQTHPVISHSTGQNCKRICDAESSIDMVDGFGNISSEFFPNGVLNEQQPMTIMEVQSPKEALVSISGKNPSQKLYRSPSERVYTIPMETSFHLNCNGSRPAVNHENQFNMESPPYYTNQENIPPSLPIAQHEVLPLRACNHRHTAKREGYATNLRPTASVNAADHVRPFRIPASELPPLRPTKSSSELPPLKPTNARLDSPASNPPTYVGGGNRFIDSGTDEHTVKRRTPSDSATKALGNGLNNHSPITNGVHTESLMSLAEGARIKREQREWSDSIVDNSKSGTDFCRNHMDGDYRSYEHRIPSNPHSLHNLSTSSVGSTGSSGSVFHSANEGNDSLNSTLNTSSLNATLTVISAGSYQPSREISKPFEMSDFYKYSTKFRRKSSTGGLSSHSGQDVGTLESGYGTIIESPLPSQNSSKIQMLAASTPTVSAVGITSPPSPTLVAQHSSPAPQQKGIYQPLTPLTCKPLDEEAADSVSQVSNPVSTKGSWEHTPIHQAVPVSVTTKRSATLV